jgi:hypothetical protein
MEFTTAGKVKLSVRNRLGLSIMSITRFRQAN